MMQAYTARIAPNVPAMEIGKTLRARNRSAWRAWLQKHHASANEIWLVSYTKASGRPFVAYDDAVQEALCFGWIDSIVKKLGPDSRAQRYTPRRKGSPVSPLNLERIRRLQAQGLMTPAGLAAAGQIDTQFRVPADILAELKSDKQTWKNFRAFPESYKRIRVGWIDGSRNSEEVFRRRLNYFLKMTKQNKRFGTMP
jgi:uncharacterized protein YdeI (YjbR/CyaY-like superfamily)